MTAAQVTFESALFALWLDDPLQERVAHPRETLGNVVAEEGGL